MRRATEASGKIEAKTVSLFTGLMVFILLFGRPQGAVSQPVSKEAVVDLSVTNANNLPCWWPLGAMSYQQSVSHRRNGQFGPWFSTVRIIDEHTGTHLDAPAGFIPPVDSGLPGAGSAGEVTVEKVPLKQLMGMAVVIDVTEILDQSEPGASPRITVEIIKNWEKKNRQIGPGDVVLFHTGYVERYYKRGAEGNRFVLGPVVFGSAPAWPAPTAAAVRYLAAKGVKHLAIDAPSMGPIPGPEFAKVHTNFLGESGVFTELAANFDKLPPTGAFYIMLPAKLAGGSGAFGRAIAIRDKKLVERLSRSLSRGKVVDLTANLREDLPVRPPIAITPYRAVKFHDGEHQRGDYFNFTRFHILDDQMGTQLDAPVHWIAPPETTLPGSASVGSISNEKVPLNQLMGPARVIDVTVLSDTGDSPGKSPAITVEHIKDYEKTYGVLNAGDVVLLRTGWDKYFRPFPDGSKYWGAVLGRGPGWPAASRETVKYIRDKGVRLIVFDTPSGGAVDNPASAHAEFLGRGGVFVEGAVNLGALPSTGAFFLFLNAKNEGASGGNGRAIAFVLPEQQANRADCKKEDEKK